MNKYLTTTKTKVVTENTELQPDNYSSILLRNIGSVTATVDSNIPLPAGAAYEWKNEPQCTINQSTTIRFADSADPKKVLVIFIYNKPV